MPLCQYWQTFLKTSIKIQYAVQSNVHCTSRHLQGFTGRGGNLLRELMSYPTPSQDTTSGVNGGWGGGRTAPGDTLPGVTPD